MPLLVVMAHYDVDRRLRAHTLRAIRNYTQAAERVVIVSTSGALDDDLASLPAHAEFHTRPNFGYDFFSYKWGLDLAGDYAAYDRIVIANDSFVGPFVPLRVITESVRAEECDLLGITWSARFGGHAQSFFLTVNRAVARSNGFQRFWRDMVPLSDRTTVIREYEAGLTQAVRGSGFRAGAYFQPTDAEDALARARFEHQLTVRLKAGQGATTVAETTRRRREILREYNPVAALADRALLDDRLPLLKFDTLRFDPYGLGADLLLAAAEQRHPEQMDGVREYLRHTRARYPHRTGELNLLPDRRYLQRTGLGYTADAAFPAHDSERDLANR
ncbi:hypothetical protein E4U02_14835 [Microbacterium paludicola]|uniref:Uncharacterized protein n=1 Tax=Microbacterium paludicola TaxID=300019 RepID=A0A4Y9FM18_9MICO|nr:rhamnan synthesis F family protein [Microbacterium paludicola]MBF0817680.1 hypothetical protein [Microbacterium paludicola]TFU30267.1 hypothetical protein E4U02_14835 [Microbacterium paludicola]